jgi:hypothetical protein
MILIIYGTNSVMVVVGLNRDRSIGGKSPLSEVPISSLAVLATYAFCQLRVLSWFRLAHLVIRLGPFDVFGVIRR